MPSRKIKELTALAVNKQIYKKIIVILIQEMLLVAHGSSKYDTICTLETKVSVI